MNNKLEALRESFDKQFINLCSIVIPKEGNHRDMDRKEEVWDFFLSRFATIMDEVVESIVPEEKEISVSWDTAEGTDNWIVQFWEKDENGIVTLTHSLNKNSDEGGGFILPSAIATIKNNYKEIKQ